MKKHVVGFMLLVMLQNTSAMELVSLKLSSDNDAKALRLAKLFNKYPKGYGENKEEKQKVVCNMNCFLQNEQYKPLYSCVKKYQRVLKNMEAEEVWGPMYEELMCDVRSHLFAKALYDGAAQYYAISNALKFVVIEPEMVWSGYYSSVMDWYRPCFLAELQENDIATIEFSNCGPDDELYPSDDSIVPYYCHFEYEGQFSHLHLRYCKRKTIRELVAFVDKDVRKARVEAFKKLFAGWVECLSKETNKEKCMSTFIELLGFLNWRDIELANEKDCIEVLKRDCILQNIKGSS